MRFCTVDVSQIVGAADRSGFADEDIERLALHILAVGGLVRPLVLEKVGICQETYRDILRVVDGHLSYWAAVRAKELEPKSFGMVNAFVLVSELQIKAVIDQVEFLDLVVGVDAEDEILTVENAQSLINQSISRLSQVNLALGSLIV